MEAKKDEQLHSALSHKFDACFDILTALCGSRKVALTTY